MLTAASRRPKRSTVRSTRSRTSSSWRMSARMNSASVPSARSSRTRVSPASSWRPETTIRLPCCAKANAAARPIPVSATVINTTEVLIVSAQDETGVGGFLALLQVQRQPAGVDQHLALLAWDVGAHVPGLRAREQSRIDQLGDMVAPGFLGFLRRLDPAEVVTPHVLDARDDEVALQLGAGRPVAERRRALRAVDIKQAWGVRARHAQMRARAAGPFLTQRRAVGAANVDAGQAAREEIEPRRQYENVELDFPVLRLDTRRRRPFDWGLEQVDKLDV